MLVLRDIMFGNRRHFNELPAGSEDGIASNILASRPKQLSRACSRAARRVVDSAPRASELLRAACEASLHDERSGHHRGAGGHRSGEGPTC